MTGPLDPSARGVRTAPPEPGPSPYSLTRLFPLLMLLLGIAAFFVFGVDDYVTFEALRRHRTLLMDFVAAHAVLAVLIYMAAYAVSTALSVPGGAVLTVAGGFLFGSWLGTLYAVAGAAVGAVAVFLIARTALGEAFRARAGPAVRKMEAGFRENAISYLLVLRLIPLFPFCMVNIVPAFLGVSLRVYTAATLVGIIPGAFVYATVGAGLGGIFDSGESVSLGTVMSPEIVGALVGLSLLALAPVFYKKFRNW